METYLIGVDTSKHNFQVCGVTRDGRKTFERKVNRSQVIGVLTGYPGAKVALEVGSGAHFFGRTLKGLGHEVLLVPAFFVKPSWGGVSPTRDTVNSCVRHSQATNLPSCS